MNLNLVQFRMENGMGAEVTQSYLRQLNRAGSFLCSAGGDLREKGRKKKNGVRLKTANFSTLHKFA